MDTNIKIYNVLPTSFDFQSYASDDITLLSASRLDTAFTGAAADPLAGDYIEFYAYDENKNLIYPNNPNIKAVSVTTFDVLQGDTFLKPSEDLEKYGFSQGSYFTTYNFYRKHLASDIVTNYYISEISSDRTEVRLKSNAITDASIISSSLEFIQYRTEANYFVDFYLNFGNDQQVIANNLRLDTESEIEPSVLVKLYEPLPSQFNVKSTLWVVEEISNPQAYNVVFPQLVFEDNDIQFIQGPNYSLQVKNETGEASETFSYNTLIGTDLTSSFNQLKSLLDKKEIDISVNYEDYNEFIHFSSALTRLENFYYKVGLIQSASNQLSSSLGSITGPTTSSLVYSSSAASFSAKIENVIENFDGYEYFLYFNSGSSKSYPKSSTLPPYTLYPTGSTEVLNWLGSGNPESGLYGGQAFSASEYDFNNIDYLYNTIPEYLRSDSSNKKYELFVDMVAQQYDNTWLYTKDVTKRFDGDNRLDYGISKDLVADAIRDFGIKLYSNNFNNDDLYTSFLGITPSGSTFPLPNMSSDFPAKSGQQYVDTKITASNDIMPLDNVNKRLYKRIYHNLPYLLKTKGTVQGLRALITSYGIPSTILRINEFGGKDRQDIRDWDFNQNSFNYALDLDRSTQFTSSFKNNTAWDNVQEPQTIQFRFKTITAPTASLYQNIWVGNNANSFITLEYTGASGVSGSYSGSVPSLNKNFGTLKFYPRGNAEYSLTASIDAPFFDNGWWSVMTTMDYTNSTASLFAGNRLDQNIQYFKSASVPSEVNTYRGITTCNFPFGVDSGGINLDGTDHLPLTGSIQEIRYWDPIISASSFEDFIVNPYSVEGNSINSTPNELTFRAALGTELNTGSRQSIHPKITGSYVVTQSFANNSSFYITPSGSFTTNRELALLNHPNVGITTRVNDKIYIANNVIPSGSTLSPIRSIAQSPYISGSEPNASSLEVAFSPTDQVNDDIIAQIGDFNIGDYIGNPLQVMQNRTAGQYVTGSEMPFYGTTSQIPDKDSYPDSYPNLDALRDSYFKKYIKGYDVNDFIRLISFFDNSLFKMIEDFTPARTTLTSGVVIKQNLLERNKYAPPSASYEDVTYSGSVKSFARDYNTGSSDYPQYDPISGSSVYVTKGGTGGVFEPFNTEYAAPVYYSGSSTLYSGLTSDEVVSSSFYSQYEVTQSFTESLQSISGAVTLLRQDQREFYDGEFQAGKGALQVEIPESCAAYFGNNGIVDMFYRIQWFFGQRATGSVMTEAFFLDDRNCPADGNAWFWTANDEAGFKAKYIKISNISVNKEVISNFITSAEYITFNLSEARTGGSRGELLQGFQTWYISNATVKDDGIPSTFDCSLIIIDPNDSSDAVKSNDDLFTNFSFSASGQFIWYATGSGVDPNVTRASNITESAPQGYFPPVQPTLSSSAASLNFFVHQNAGSDYRDVDLRVDNVTPAGGFGGSGSFSWTGEGKYLLQAFTAGAPAADSRYAMNIYDLTTDQLVFTASQGGVETNPGYVSASATPNNYIITYPFTGSPGHLYGLYMDAIPSEKFTPVAYDQRYNASYSGSNFNVRTRNYPLSASNIITVQGQPSSVPYTIVNQVGAVSPVLGDWNRGYPTLQDYSSSNISTEVFPTTEFVRGWGSAVWYGNQLGVPVYEGSGSGFVFDPNNNFNSGSKEVDKDAISNATGIYRPSTYPWYMNAVPTQSLIPESNFQEYPSTLDSADMDRFENESLNFGPQYTVFEPATPVQAVGVLSSSLGSGPQPNQGNVSYTCAVLLSDIPNVTGGVAFTAATVVSDANVNWSSSITFLSPSQQTAQTVVPWISVVAGTGTGGGSLVSNTKNIQVTSLDGVVSFGQAISGYTRTAILNIFRELDDGSYEALNYGIGCLIMQPYLANDTSGGISGGGGNGTGGGLLVGNSKIICNELYKQGYLTEEMWDADERYGAVMFDKDPALIIGYQMWARYVIKYMRKNPQHTKYLYNVIFKPWTEYMGYEMGVLKQQNYIGKIMHKIGSLPTYLLFYLGGGKRLLNIYNYKRFKKSWSN